MKLDELLAHGARSPQAAMQVVNHLRRGRSHDAPDNEFYSDGDIPPGVRAKYGLPGEPSLQVSEQTFAALTETYSHPELRGRVVTDLEAPSRILMVPTVGALAISSNATETIRFSAGAGLIVGMRGSVHIADGSAAELNNIQLTMNINGSEELITDGDAVAPASYADLFAGAQQYMPFRRYMSTKDRMNFTFSNISTTTAHIPTLALYFVRLRPRTG